MNSFTNLYALYSSEYVPSLCQVGARSINTNLLDLASNLVFTNTGQSLGTCAQRSQNSCTFENCYFIGSGPGIGPHNSFSQVLDTLSYGSSLHYVCRWYQISGQDNFNDSFILYDTTYDTVHDNSCAMNSTQCNILNTNTLVDGGGHMALVWPANREFDFMPINIPKFIPTVQSNVIQYSNSIAWVNKMNTEVAKYNSPNYLGAQSTVPSGLNISSWKYILKHYDLKILDQYLEYGFPLNLVI